MHGSTILPTGGTTIFISIARVLSKISIGVWVLAEAWLAGSDSMYHRAVMASLLLFYSSYTPWNNIEVISSILPDHHTHSTIYCVRLLSRGAAGGVGNIDVSDDIYIAGGRPYFLDTLSS